MKKTEAPESASEPGDQSQDTASFLRRLAGPSVMKAGLAKDQTEINRIIAEASKGSKFYENEKRKDKELTERIDRILKQRDDAMRGADIAKIEVYVDHLLEEMEAHRDLTQIIVHVDMDAFYASVELLDDPSLQGKPFAVGHGVVSTASYEARKQGVRSGMAEFIAMKLCPELVVVSTHFPRYMEISNKVMNILRRYDPNMQPGGCDEGYLNITEYCETHVVSAGDCVQQMRDIIHKETGLTVSAGVAPNKMLAKVSLGKTNKPNGQFMLEFTPEAVKGFMHNLPIRKVPGIGRVNERLLDSIGIKTCGDIYTHRATASLMDKQFGLVFLLQTYLGIASNIVQPFQREERKSIGTERTFHSIGNKESILEKLEEIAAELEEDMERTGWTGKTITLKYKLDTYQVFTRAKSFDRWISTKKEDLFAVGKELLLPELPLKLRLIGLRVTKLKDLRENAEAKPGSIKRFFESANPPTSPRKKRKLEESPDEERTSLSQDGYEEYMPNADDDAEYDGECESHEEIFGLNEWNVKKPTSSASINGSEKKPSRSVSPTKPVSTTSNSSIPEVVSEVCTANHTCPICSKTLQTDNQGLNAHIDFCLSKGAILEAQAAASGGTTHKLKTSTNTLHSWTKRTKKRK
ncbi:IMS-domain-containing protein [Irpex rosettiformis]|uniref:IMS-domain-containing protein n=1 Tax=Irpex rosettiformis TaxID=378272 RepID=A0ACB8TT17_9APHY|nr:IMS-domain-containing protein [Irpex rosettiformis]